MKKIRKRARFPRRSYGGGYEKPSKSSRPATSYKAPSSQVSTHRPYVAPKSKSKPFTSFRSISSKSSKPASTYSVTTPSYSAPEPPRESYSSPSPPPQTYSVRTPPSTYSKPPPSTYSKPPPSTYSRPPPSTYSKPPSTYSKPSAYSTPPSDSYSGGEYSYSYAVPETETQAWEERNGYSTTGSYSVLLPDGRTMTVSYSVPDTETGFVAEVSYQGEARYQDYEPQQQYNHKREVKQKSSRNQNNFPNFRPSKTYEKHLEKELELPRQDLPTNAFKFERKKSRNYGVKSGAKEREEKKIKYPHFESFQYSGTRNEDVRPGRLVDPVALFGEFPQLNPRPDQIQPKQQSLHFISPERQARPSYLSPIEIIQEDYQTNFASRPIREERNKEQAPTATAYLNTNVKPFVNLPAKHSPAVLEDKYG